MRNYRDLVRLVGIGLGLLLSLVGCIGPDQHFPPGSPLWHQANPARVGADASHRHRVLVAVLDGGIDYNIPSLQRNIHSFGPGLGWDTLGQDHFPYFTVLNPRNGADMSEELNVAEHGTHVCQLVALTNPQIGLLPIRVLPLTLTEEEDRNSDSTDPRFLAEMSVRVFERLNEGLRFAAAQGATIVNMSLGISLEEIAAHLRGTVLERLETTLVAPMRDEWSQMLFVVAAGNESTNLTRIGQSVPATLPLPSLLSVGALKDHRTISYFSNYGRYVDVYVRGSDIASAVPGGIRKKMSGTSMASPLVAHLAAEIKILLPSLTPAELRALIINTADERTLSVEKEENAVTAKVQQRHVRVVNMRKAREIARKLAANPALAKHWLTAPFPHGGATE